MRTWVTVWEVPTEIEITLVSSSNWTASGTHDGRTLEVRGWSADSAAKIWKSAAEYPSD